MSSITALQGEGGRSVPSDVPALTTPSQIIPATPTGSQPEGVSRLQCLRQCPSVPLFPHRCRRQEDQSSKEHTLQNSTVNGLLTSTLESPCCSDIPVYYFTIYIAPCVMFITLVLLQHHHTCLIPNIGRALFRLLLKWFRCRD